MSERTGSKTGMVSGEQQAGIEKPFRFIPKTTVGKALLALYLVAFVAVALSVTGIIFADPEMLGPMAAPALWAYIWFGVMNAVLIGTYFFLFKPWAESAERFIGDQDDRTETKRQQRSPDGVVAEEGEN